MRQESVRRDLYDAASQGLAWNDFSRTAIGLIAHLIPHDAICLATTDPLTGLLNSSFKEGIDSSADDHFIHLEYSVPDVNKYADLADDPVGIAILAHSTDGAPMRSVRYRDLLRPHYGLEHELRGVLRTGGRVWGTCSIYRAPDSPAFTHDEAAALGNLTDLLARGARYAAVVSKPGALLPAAWVEPAVLVVDEHGVVTGATGPAEQRVAQLDGHLWHRLGTPIASTVEAARTAIDPTRAQAQVVARTGSGEWLAIGAAVVGDQHGPGDPRVAPVTVTIKEAHVDNVLPLLYDAYQLSPRERQLVDEIRHGASTKSIAADLHISVYTVQDHFKTIFDKVGVSSRRELTALLTGLRPTPNPRVGPSTAEYPNNLG